MIFKAHGFFAKNDAVPKIFAFKKPSTHDQVLMKSLDFFPKMTLPDILKIRFSIFFPKNDASSVPGIWIFSKIQG